MTGDKLRKYLSALAVVLILIGAPLGSYMYLRSGFEYRIQYMEELEPRDSVPLVLGIDNFIRKTNGKVRLIHVPSSDGVSDELKLLEEVSEQIVDTTYFAAITLANIGPSQEGSKVRSIQEDPSTLPTSDPFIVVDTAGLLRSSYSLDENTKKRIIKHLSVLIPLPPKQQIVLKRTMEQEDK